MYITRGSTPQINLNLSVETRDIAEIYITFTQYDGIKIEKTKTDCLFSENMVSFRLTQKETLNLRASYVLNVQARIKLKDGRVLPTNVCKADVCCVLKDGEI